MTLRFTIIAIGVVLVFLYGQRSVGSSSMEIKNHITLVHSNQSDKVSKGLSVIEVVDMEGFISGTKKKVLELGFFKLNFRLIHKEVIQNKHDLTLTDTIIIYSNGVDTAVFYVSKPNRILNEVRINSEKLILDNNIKIGMSDNVFKRKFKLEEMPDSLLLTDLEYTNHFLFIFKQHILSKIIYKATYID